MFVPLHSNSPPPDAVSGLHLHGSPNLPEPELPASVPLVPPSKHFLTSPASQPAPSRQVSCPSVSDEH